MDNLYTDIRFCVADLRPGFKLITDLSDCTLLSLRGLPTFNKRANHLISNKVAKVIRIIDIRKKVVSNS